ncbi:glycosyltransferase family 2 protein [Roseibacterium sp. SDUM158017]|uniref:glycosyltransferase family 2 protein n=1 Tax=Roseicyclus salinarum TaxID=3036773 RepID=UPI0024151292|nr:glycosyltransferase family 2 protein [Roseibacterium sp. SDUM158017]MDG4649330.1 glycosyltransferase family 2 protein [Roseibacterium sp. SDUM158017]
MDSENSHGPTGTTILSIPAGERAAQALPIARPAGRTARTLHVMVRRDATEGEDAGAADLRLAQTLVARGWADAAEVRAARATATSLGLPLGRVLVARGKLGEEELLSALCEVYRTGRADVAGQPPEPRMAQCLPRDVALAAEAVPWRDAGGALIVATARPDLMDEVAAALPPGRRAVAALASRDDIAAAQTALWGASLAREAETRVPEHVSCRTWKARRLLRAALFVAIAVALIEMVFPEPVAIAAFGIAGLAFVANIALKAAAFVAMLRSPAKHAPPTPGPDIAPHLLRPPMVSILVPLYREAEIAHRLVANLSRLRYAPERLDVLLLIEEDDHVTAEAIRAAPLPPWMRAIIVPEGHPRTKPRALNYALAFARGDIVGIYDAEDRPDPNQIAHVVRRFDEVGQNVACLQGRLDYYNAGHNLMSRLFTIEYASWFRVILPGVERLGLVVPLGGTTLFLRRDALEKVGGWDAHNVTEDAELGLRLARAGYRTELVDTTTFEEANAAVMPWVRQRSRWLKGYLITWATAMREPRALWRDLGAWRFFGLQAQMLAAVLGFFLAPLLWSLVLLPFGVPHPLDGVLSPSQGLWIGAFMMLSFVLSVAVSVHACAAPHLRHLRMRAPLVEFYYTLGTLAAWIGALELMAKPFFWAKTRHGVYGGGDVTEDASATRGGRA